ncbi:AMP-binding protein [Microbacterium sp. BWT-B31]|uniref:class I adenylate-forming enzyme family protein n=1 Tax=Microbacterium sp. BWT-B31 TaxID=3232072 RepID=UPI003528CA16
MEPTPAQLLRNRAYLTPDAEAYVSGGRRLTFAQAAREAGALAGHLAANGVARGDRVVVLAKNGDFLATSLFAASWIGAIAVVANWRLPLPELAYVVADSGATALLYDEEFAETAAALVGDPSSFSAVVGSDPEEYLPIVTTGVEPLHAPVGTAADPAVIMYTSGTTGRPKGAVLTGANLFWSAQGMVTTLVWEQAHRFLLVAPMFHIGGLAPLMANVLKGTATVFLRDFDPAAVWRTIADERITTMMTVPLMLKALMHAASQAQVDPSSLFSVTCGGAMVPASLVEAFTGMFGVPVQVVYGITEFTGGVTFQAPSMGPGRPSSQGKAVFHAELAVASLESGERLGVGEAGEVLVRGPQRFAGYWGKPDATGAAITEDGWYRSGDVGYLDENGYVHLIDRVKDVIISGGENIYPAEVEAVLATHPAVADVAVVGRPDDTWGEVPAAFVVLKPGADVSADELVALCREQLAGYKRPKHVEFIEAVPRNTLGKVLKRELRVA